MFNTAFDVLDASKGRNQTTKGIHLSVDRECKSLVIDIEGTDSQIRGDDGSAFEHMSALFALAVADVLMVNMWTNEIGRYKAASVGLLKTIFEVNLKLFTQEGKKRILFILRDFNEQQNNIGLLKQQISKTMEQVWETIKKPSTHSLLTVFDCFEFDFKTIEVKDFKQEEFISDIAGLRERFTQSELPDYLFRCKNTDIPIDGIPLYYSEIWTLITSDKDLNIPSQKEMLANLRCNELKLEALQVLSQSMELVRKHVGQKVVEDFAVQFTICINEALHHYDQHGVEYYEVVYQTIRVELHSLLIDQIKDLFNQQMRCLVKECSAAFKVQLKQSLSSDLPVEDFTQLVESIRTVILSRVSLVVGNSVVEGSGWGDESYVQELIALMEQQSDSERDRQLGLLSKEINKSFAGRFSREATQCIEKFYELDIWAKLRELQANHMRELEMRAAKVLLGLGHTEERVTEYVQATRKVCYERLRDKAKHYTRNLADHLTKRFNALFNKDERGILREWKHVEVEELFEKVRGPVIKLLEQFRYCYLAEDWEAGTPDEGEPLLESHEYELILENFTNNIDESYKNAAHIKEFGYAQKGIPSWFWILLLVLGWNEILYLVSSPIILYPLLLLFSMVALLFSLGMGSFPKYLSKQLLARLNIRLF